ncbi:MAG: undecaprenyldiphospho-muramoylpentapeptide beta-N-acetylglucosaminyltransferase [Lachnospiraceae bacterium]
MNKIVMTGGGTAGHVTPNIALMPLLKQRGYHISYVGSYDGIEKKLIDEQHIPYYGISSGKLRRYFDWKNFSDPFKVVKGYQQAKQILKKIKPDIVFSKGGFVSVPIVLAAKHLHIPAIIHESDITPGLANKLALSGAQKVCCNFPETLNYLPAEKAVLTGSPIRHELLNGDKEKGRLFCNFHTSLPVLLIIGGSIGSVFVNDALRSILDSLLKSFQIVHICGEGNLSPAHEHIQGYLQLAYVNEELADLFALADLVISRAGANTICELLALKKPNLLIPLGSSASRGDQILNAHSFEKQGFSMVLEQEQLNNQTLEQAIQTLYKNRQTYIAAMSQTDQTDPIELIVNLIQSYTKERA